MTLVKICGLTERDDALRAAEFGADALGFVFAPRSARRADPETVAGIVSQVPSHVTTIGVFQDQPIDVVRDVVLGCGLQVAQLHGSEGEEYIADLGLPVLRALGLCTAADIDRLRSFRDLDVILLDSARVEADSSGSDRRVSGGTGRPFDWTWLGGIDTPARVVLSGGLRPENVAQAIEAVRPWAVDVASGVERSPGRKDPDRMQAFIATAKVTDPSVRDDSAEPWGAASLAGPGTRTDR